MVIVPTEPEIPRLFELKLKVTEFADAIGDMARAAATNKTDTAILRLVILTTRFSSYDEVVVLRRSCCFPHLAVSGARRVPSHDYLRNFNTKLYLNESQRLTCLFCLDGWLLFHQG